MDKGITFGQTHHIGSRRAKQSHCPLRRYQSSHSFVRPRSNSPQPPLSPPRLRLPCRPWVRQHRTPAVHHRARASQPFAQPDSLEIDGRPADNEVYCREGQRRVHGHRHGCQHAQPPSACMYEAHSSSSTGGRHVSGYRRGSSAVRPAEAGAVTGAERGGAGQS